MRLIDADAMFDDVLRQIETIKALGNEELTEISLVIYDGIKQEICKQPTVDAVEVVRCRDCKYYRKIDHGGICVLLAREEKMTDDWFCADGERRDPCSSQDS